VSGNYVIQRIKEIDVKNRKKPLTLEGLDYPLALEEFVAKVIDTNQPSHERKRKAKFQPLKKFKLIPSSSAVSAATSIPNIDTHANSSNDGNSQESNQTRSKRRKLSST
jgi:hypothetical protein